MIRIAYCDEAAAWIITQPGRPWIGCATCQQAVDRVIAEARGPVAVLVEPGKEEPWTH